MTKNKKQSRKPKKPKKKPESLKVSINPNGARNAMHTSICMVTGGGKGIALNELNVVPLHHPVIIFDPHHEHKTLAGRKVYQYKTRLNFARTFLKAWSTGKPFALAYTPIIRAKEEKENKKQLQNAAEWFAKLAYTACDGNRILYAVFEEYGAYCEGVSDDKTTIGKIWTEGRKFGLRGVAIFQRSATISKTIWSNSPIKIIGAQGYENDLQRCIEATGCNRADMIDLAYRNKALQMHYAKIDEMVRTKVHYLVSESVGTFEKVAAFVKPAANLRKKWSTEQRKIDKSGQYRLNTH
jgi:DNA helicase HerA-like ATPase